MLLIWVVDEKTQTWDYFPLLSSWIISARALMITPTITSTICKARMIARIISVLPIAL